MAFRLFTAKQVKPVPNTSPVSVVSIYDRYSSYPSQGLTPLRLTEISREADQGDIYRQAELFEEMLEKDGHLFSIFQSRKLGVLSAEYEILPGGDDPQSKKIAEFLKVVIEDTKQWRTNLEDILDAVPKGFSAQWIEWATVPDSRNTVTFADLHYVHQKNFRFGKGSDVRSDLNELRRVTDENRFDGIELEMYKWLVPVIKARSGHPSRASIARTCTWPYLFKNFGVKSFLQFCEIFGIPLRVGKYEQGISDEDKLALYDALKGLSTDAAVMISKNTEIEFPETTQKGTTTELYDRFIALMNREQSQAVLGHTGASESTPGKLGNETAAMDIRHDLLAADAMAMDYAISDQLFKPLTLFNFGPQVKYPTYKTKLEKPRDLVETAKVDESLVNMGWRPTTTYITETYGRPIPTEADQVLEPRQQQVLPFGSAAAKAILGPKADLLK